MVALDSNGRPTGMPAIKAVSPDELRRYEAAQERRRVRLQLKDKFNKNRRNA